MTEGAAIVGLGDWLKSPAGRYLIEWEQRHVDAMVADIFGFHALQLGLSELDALKANRMPHRWTCVPQVDGSVSHAEGAQHSMNGRGVALCCDFDALPFDAQSLDLVVMPHTLELARDPHETLREVDRVLRPEGQVVILGFNSASLWGLRQRMGTLRRGFGFGTRKPLFLPRTGDFIGYRRLRDWLRLLSFEVESGRFGCYVPPARSQQWLSRFDWMERAGDRWWPVFGAVYALTAVKRVRGMRLVGLARDQRTKAKAAPAVAVHHRREKTAAEQEP